MSETSIKLRRILLPMDVSRDSLTALNVAFDLAAALQGEVAGMFIEDADLIAAVTLPFAREVGSFSGISKQIGNADIENRFRAVAGKAREAVVQAGRKLKVPASFRVTRGDVPDEILTAAADADLVILGKAGWSAGTIRVPGRTCLAILSRSKIPVLIAEHGSRLGPPVMVIHDHTEAGERALEVGRELSRSLGWDMVIFWVEGMSGSDQVLEKMHEGKARLMVLPSSLPLREHAHQLLKWPVLFVP
jgi:nucleotide-binding universal stress UspA family protein